MGQVHVLGPLLVQQMFIEFLLDARHWCYSCEQNRHYAYFPRVYGLITYRIRTYTITGGAEEGKSTLRRERSREKPLLSPPKVVMWGATQNSQENLGNNTSSGKNGTQTRAGEEIQWRLWPLHLMMDLGLLLASRADWEEEAGSKTEEMENKLEPASTSASTSHYIEAPPTATNGCGSTSTS